MINYAHRGASQYAPENTLSSFCLGLMQGANGIETDVRKTKDGRLVLFHDDTLERVSDFSGKVSDYTLSELEKAKIYGNAPNGFFDRIITLEEFLEKFSVYDIAFAIELKGESVEKETYDAVKRHGIINKTTFTSFNFEYLKAVKQIDKTARVGYLVSEINDEVINALESIGGEEIAPHAEALSEEIIKKLRAMGFGVRAWGVKNTEIMKKTADMKVDGMTVNFPDKLFEYLGTLKA